MIPGQDKCIWLIWALDFLVLWAMLYVAFPEQRRIMW